MKIILAEEKHVPGIIEIWKEFIDFHAEIDPFFARAHDAEQEFEEWIRIIIEDESGHSLVVLDNNQVIAFSISRISKHPPVWKQQDYGEIIELAVNREYRRQGIGEEMLKIIFAWFEANDVKRIELKVASKNDIGYSFWEKHGFMDYMHVLYLDR
jgi:ribosomal protein S18 acetylase RimI-like enzyme